MKIKKFLICATPVMATAAAIMPFTTSCSDNNKTVGLSNTQIKFKSESEARNTFGITGNFNQGTNYHFPANMTTWDNDHGKPKTEDDWNKLEYVCFKIGKLDETEFTLNNVDGIKIDCNGKELIKGTQAQVEAGEAQWYIDTTEATAYYCWIATKKGATVSYTSTVTIHNIQLAQTTENLAIVYFIPE